MCVRLFVWRPSLKTTYNTDLANNENINIKGVFNEDGSISN